ncbi:DUF2892 domain-containing protein [Paenibacillus sp. NPDC056579]|uniref:YgaP family membrane protein n=1 Tax=unclassified Paenibacillus TaxID=185978 RepID=UPI001EF7D19B|nr:DUF2892 domain-containing protein [Paenibacillus sp. H1-7]ULL19325.1 DUF2892 domain-containing protein [Paenibacillus sp. H1-7]
MKCNVGRTEQAIRIAVGSGIVAAGIVNKSWWGLLGVAPIITGATRYCPLNAALGMNHCKDSKETDSQLVSS